MIFPSETPDMIRVSINLACLYALYFSASFSNTPSNVINATYPADIAPPANPQKQTNKPFLINVNGLFVPFAVHDNCLVYIIFI